MILSFLESKLQSSLKLDPATLEHLLADCNRETVAAKYDVPSPSIRVTPIFKPNLLSLVPSLPTDHLQIKLKALDLELYTLTEKFLKV
jgi:hypothetical protein